MEWLPAVRFISTTEHPDSRFVPLRIAGEMVGFADDFQTRAVWRTPAPNLQGCVISATRLPVCVVSLESSIVRPGSAFVPAYPGI